MPNHVTNYLTFTGNENQIAKLFEEVQTKHSDFDFNSFAPMPRSLKNTSSPANIVTEEEYKQWKESNDNKKYVKLLTQKKSDNLIKKYGHNNWYNWACNNWGTKWNAYNVQITENGFIFQTAWCTPLEAMIKLSEKYPEVTIKVRYIDEDFGNNVGEYTLWNGGIEDEYTPEYSEESIRLAIDIDGGDYYYGDYLVDLDEETELGLFEMTCIKVSHEEQYPVNDFPNNILEKLLELAVKDEQFERAEEIKKQMETNLTTIKN
jgi:hypothetical protein